MIVFISKSALAAAALSLAVAPAVAAPAPSGAAAKLSLARATSHGKHSNEIVAAPLIVFGALAIGAGTAMILVNQNDKDRRPANPLPVSP